MTFRRIVNALWFHSTGVFDSVHGLSHPSIRTTVKLITSKFVWHGMSREVKEWAKSCLECQRSKIQRHVRAPLLPIRAPQHRFKPIHMDLVGPLSPSRGYTRLLTIVDRFTRWPEAIPLTQTDTRTCAQALLSNWIA